MTVNRPVQFKFGVTRVVLLVGPLAMKFPNPGGWVRFLQGLLANIQENGWHRSTPMLCPVLFHLPGGLLVVMRRCEPLADWEHGRMKAWYDRLTAETYVGEDMVEPKTCSFGWLKGRLVAVDYGT